jgi:hypothetical protein
MLSDVTMETKVCSLTMQQIQYFKQRKEIMRISSFHNFLFYLVLKTLGLSDICWRCQYIFMFAGVNSFSERRSCSASCFLQRSVLRWNSLTRVKFDPLCCTPVGLVSTSTSNHNGIPILSFLLSTREYVIPSHTRTWTGSVVGWAVPLCCYCFLNGQWLTRMEGGFSSKNFTLT